MLQAHVLDRHEDILRSISPEEKKGSEDGSICEGAQKYLDLMRLKIVHIVALFIFVYSGVEVTLGAWSVSFLIDARGGGSSSGYVSSGFFGGSSFTYSIVKPFRLIYISRTCSRKICANLAQQTCWSNKSYLPIWFLVHWTRAYHLVCPQPG